MGLHIYQDAAPIPEDLVFERRLPSRPELKEALIADIVALMEEQGCFAEADRHWLLMCLDEAIVNAMLHGNEGDPELDIVVTIAINHEANRWILMVADEGDGFCAEDVPDAEDPESLMLEHGRGILLMDQWLDELSYYDNGSTIFMARACAGAEDEAGAAG